MMTDEIPLRLNAFLARAGYGGRREATRLIAAGRVQVNGRLETNALAEIDPNRAHVRVDGKLIKRLWPLTYLMLNKPAGALTATRDQHRRRTVYDLLGRFRNVVQAVGRLDYDSEGLLLFTNDGDMAHTLTSPKSQAPKTYRVKIKGHISGKAMQKLRHGVDIGGYFTAPAKVKSQSRLKANQWLRITLTEGKYRQVKRMLAAVDHDVLRLIRTDFGPLSLGELPQGKFRHLEDWEVRRLRALMK